jgi:hypothetical protein
VGRGALPGVPRPKYGVEYERDADAFGTVLCALIVVAGRLMLPSGGRGTDRMGEVEAIVPPDLAVVAVAGSDSDLTPLCGGRGTKRPAGAGIDLALVDGPSGARLGAGVAVLWAGAGIVLGLAELAGGVILLTVGRDATAADGLAAGKPAFGPSMLSRVGETFGRLMLALDKFRKALGEVRAAFAATGNPRSRVFRETAVSPPVLA